MPNRFASAGLSRRMLVLAALVITACAFVPTAEAAPRRSGPPPKVSQTQPTVPFTSVACPIGPVEGYKVDCGYLTVAESRRNFTGKTIQLAVAIIRSPNPNPAPDPAIFLAGGPGQAALPLATGLAFVLAPVLAQRDLILIDQRGTGYSKPSLTCPFEMTMLGGRLPIGIAQTPDERPLVLQQQVAALRACGEQFRKAGIDLKAYNTVENAADLEDLRRALGYGQVNLYGGSYGTRLALTALQYRPDTIRSAVLDSVYPLEANFHVDVFASYNQSLTRLFASCAADSQCNAAFPNLATTFDQLIAKLNTNPAQVPITNPETGELITYLPISGVDTALILFQLSYITQIIPLLPFLITSTAQGDYELLGLLIALLFSSDSQTNTFSLGMQVAVQCNEDAPFASANDFVAARDRNRRAGPLAHSIVFNEAILEICSAWGLTNPDPAENQPVKSDRPTLIFSGEFDPITPPQYAEAVAANLTNDFFVAYPRGGHTPSVASLCGSGIAATFINTPTQRPDTSCIGREAPIPFIIPR